MPTSGYRPRGRLDQTLTARRPSRTSASARLKAEISQRWPMISCWTSSKSDLRVHSRHFQTATGYTRLNRLLCKNDCCCASMAWDKHWPEARQRRRSWRKLPDCCTRAGVLLRVTTYVPPLLRWPMPFSRFASRSSGRRHHGLRLGLEEFGAWDQNLMTEWHARYRGPAS